MNLINSWMHSESMKALGWTFVHSLWQIALIGFLLFVVLRLIPRRSAHTRYRISTVSLWLIVVVAAVTYRIMLPDETQVKEITGQLIFVGATEPLSFTAKMSAWFELNMPMMLTIWLGGVTILLIRLALSLGWISHIRKNATPQFELQAKLNEIIQRLNLNVKPEASTSSHIPSPLTFGFIKPLILFPVGIINQLTPYEVEAILTHELAHIVRRDYLSNLIQSFIETLFYYHPIIWWISRMVRTERENRADDLAVSWCGDQLGYAKALLTVQEMQHDSTPSLAIGFASRKGAMLARIQRILNLPYQNHNQMEKTVLLSLCSFCFLAFTLSSHTTLDTQVDKTEETSNIYRTVTVATDSIPTKGIYRIHKKTDDQDISIEVEDGDIKEFKIDGKDIQPSDFDAYDHMLDQLFGEVETPPSMEGFNYTMPPMPGMPSMPPMAPMMQGYDYMMPPMPPMPDMAPPMQGYYYTMPPMPEMSDKQFMEMQTLQELQNGDGSTITIYSPNGKKRYNLIMDDLDSSMIAYPGNFNWAGDFPTDVAISGRMMNEQEMQEWAEEMERNAQSWKDQGEEWHKYEKERRDQANEYRKHSRENADQWREQQNQFRMDMRNQYEPNEAQLRSLERELGQLGQLEQIQPFMYDYNNSRLNLSDEMVRDGLVEPGDEVEIQLTPDKLKIDGEKMPESIHQKYLKMYEQQQGLELSGNSRVEFTTKSKQRM